MDGFAVDPDLLSGAASAVTAALGNGDVATAPTVGGGERYGNAELAALMTEFGSAVALASGLLVRSAQAAAAGLRDGARRYAQSEQRGEAAINGAGAALAGQPGGR
ncbi:MAG TPA: hypothetical protein VGD73_14705 [Pseudonocardia sp.]|uniref:hypothetical protein n=1 Tax=Pseudonocardia sp. TaxID=60912 RepID=UPI002ED893A5